MALEPCCELVPGAGLANGVCSGLEALIFLPGPGAGVAVGGGMHLVQIVEVSVTVIVEVVKLVCSTETPLETAVLVTGQTVVVV